MTCHTNYGGMYVFMMAGLRLMFSKMIGLTVLKMILKENSLWPITASIKTLNGILKKRKRGSSEKVMRSFLLKKIWKVTGNS